MLDQETIRFLFQVPIHVLLLITFFGMRSLYWGRFCKVMFYLTLFHVLMLHFVSKSISTSPHDIAYISAFIAGISGSILGMINLLPNENIPSKDQTMILFCTASVIFLLLIEALLNYRVQILFNHYELRGTITHLLFKWIIVSSTILQVLISLRGGFDGWKRTTEDGTNWYSNFSLRVGLSQGSLQSHAKFKKRIEEL